ncbi:ABC transporter ATP-binding protein [Snuella lapsa]|uniref:ABC transporter domain-containing protein n=1 Tax=Snuella lapsa TaxID=870481 RepID=A0ABP6XSP9_9FLAO
MTNIKKHSTGSKEVLVEVDRLSKKFCVDLKTSLWYGLKDLYTNVLGNHQDRVLRPKEFWAVKDISFTLRRGECLGLIGHNGAGKSTLLKILNGLIKPDAGKVHIRGRVGALIELGAGFNPILSGRENIYNNGAVLGFSKAEIDAKLEAIIDFAEIREFIDMPVQHYSSGMKVRLGFAVAAQMEPDVLIVDEVLAVGDLGFILKCFKTIDTILPHTAVVFVSHNMPMVSRICNQAVLLEKGKAEFQGNNVSKAIDLYYSKFDASEKAIVFDSGLITLDSVSIITDKYSKGIPVLSWKDDLILCLKLTNLKLEKVPYISVYIYDKEQRSAGVLFYEFTNKSIAKGGVNISLIHKNIQFSKGIYNMTIIIYEEFEYKPIYRVNSIQSFQIEHNVESWTPLLLDSNIFYENN